MKSQDQFVADLCRKHKRADLVMVAREKGVRPDETMTKKKIATLIYRVLLEAYKRETGEKILAELHTQADEAKEGLAKDVRETNLNPMKKPASYKILAANESVYGGILGERVDPVRKVVIVVTGHGQKWEFPVT